VINIILIGRKGEGKSTFVRKYIAKRRALLFDVNNEYKDLKTDNRLQRSRMVELDHKEFIRLCLTKKNTVCVFEDATGFLEGRLDGDFRKSFVSTRHTGNANIYIFHSILSVPPKMIQLSDYIILHKTNDERKHVEKKYPSLLKYYDYLRDKPQFSNITIKL